MTTHEDMVTLLQRRNYIHRYDRLIKDCKARLFHDIDSPYRYPKTKLYERLAEFPELLDFHKAIYLALYGEQTGWTPERIILKSE